MTIHNKALLPIGLAVALSLAPAALWAKATTEELKKIGMEGTELTPVGAIRAGNADGSIPAWSGGLPQKDVPKGKWLDDPFAADKPLFTITTQNYKQYADKLSPGQVAMFEHFPDYKMNIYPTRRSASFKPHVYEAALFNAANAEMNPSGIDFHNAKITWAFPIPHDGNEAMMSYSTKPREAGTRRWANTTVVTSTGDYQTSKIVEEIMSDWSKEGNTPETITGDNDVFYFLQSVMAPPKNAGGVILILDGIHQDGQARRIWAYNQGQRRVRRAPQVQYDNPKTGGDGLATSDQLGMYNGKIDRYNWKLVGKKEMFVPYNAHMLHTDKVKIADIVRPGHINQDLARYELHRVWHVEGDLKPDTSHIYKKRVFFMDEDSWQIVVMDHYDKRDQLWRMTEGHLINSYDILTTTNTAEIHYDLQSGRYLAVGFDNEDGPPDNSFRAGPERYSPDALRQEGVR